MSSNLIGFGDYGLADVADPHGTVSTRILGPTPGMVAPSTISMTAAGPSPALMTPPTIAPLQPQLITPDNGYVPPDEYVPPEGIEEQIITTLPGELPPEAIVPEPAGLDWKMIGLGVAAVALLGAGYWFFIAKKPKGEQA